MAGKHRPEESLSLPMKRYGPADMPRGRIITDSARNHSNSTIRKRAVPGLTFSFMKSLS